MPWNNSIQVTVSGCTLMCFRTFLFDFSFFSISSPFWLQLQPWICDLYPDFSWVSTNFGLQTVHLSLPLRRFSRVSTSNFSPWQSWTQVTYATSGAEIATLELDPTQSAQEQFGRVGIKSEAKCLILICVNHDNDELKISNDIHCCL